jgi:thymidine phosphorylase
MRGEAHERARPVTDLSVELTARMLTLSGLESDIDTARQRVKQALDSGAALECFRKNIEAQGGDARVCDDPSRLLDLKLHEVRVESPRTGFVNEINTAEIGNAVASIGGGRIKIEDDIDHAVGFLVLANLGDEIVESDKTLGLLYCRNDEQAAIATKRIRSAYTISDDPPSNEYRLIKEVID